MNQNQLLVVRAFGLSLALLLSGCTASSQARKRAEQVAKGWCETIRASQVIPVYPMTQDVVVGDVFLVQTPIANQASLYKAKGFLPLDDFQVRLPYTDFSKLYFDGYWKDEFGATPHPMPHYTNAGSLQGQPTVSLTEAPLPRAAFPSYSFKAESGFGLNAAFPISGVPVALSYLNSGQVNGSVTISDARTYGGDTDALKLLLRKWAGRTAKQEELARVATRAAAHSQNSVFLRVVSRVYYARAIDLSLHRADSQSAGGKGGVVNDVSLFKTNGTVNENYTNVLNLLNAAVSPVAGAAQVGAAAKFVAVSESTVGLAQTFDRLLVIGYLGFDVPVNAKGELGAAIPTFQRLSGMLPEPAPVRIGALTEEQSRFRISQDALKSLAQTEPKQALAVIEAMLKDFEGKEFGEARKALKPARQAAAGAQAKKIQELVRLYQDAARDYVTVDSNQGPRYAIYDAAFCRAYDQRDKQK